MGQLTGASLASLVAWAIGGGVAVGPTCRALAAPDPATKPVHTRPVAAALAVATPADLSPAGGDWLVRAPDRKAVVVRSADGRDVHLANGLLRRTWRVAPNVAATALDDLSTGAALLRGVKPEAVVEIDGVAYDIGGLRGQPNYAFLKPE